MLTGAEVARYLLARGLVTPRSIVDGDFIVRDASSRNCNFEVECKGASSFLLKQGIGPMGEATVAHEAAVYHMLGEQEQLRPYLPRLYGYDAGTRVLVLELIEGGQDLRNYHRRRGRFSVELAAALGSALGVLHRLTMSDSGVAVSRRVAPWILSVHRPSSSIFRNLSAASIELIKIVQKAPRLCEHLDELRETWQPGTFTHFDVKWDNVIVFRPSGSHRITGMKMIDWEGAGIGDPCWDIGSVFSHYLSFWLFSIPATGQVPPAQFPELARYPLAGARLIQTAFEASQMATEISASMVLHLRLCQNILERPREAAVHLLSLPLPRWVAV